MLTKPGEILAVFFLLIASLGTPPTYASETSPLEKALNAYLSCRRVDRPWLLLLGVEGSIPDLTSTATVLGAGYISRAVVKPPRAVDRVADRFSTGVPSLITVTGLAQSAGKHTVDGRNKIRRQLMTTVSTGFPGNSFRSFVEHYEQGWRLKPLMNEQFAKRPTPELTWLNLLEAKLQQGPVPKLYSAKEANQILDLTIARLVSARLRAVRFGLDAVVQFDEEWKKYASALEDIADPKQTLKRLDLILSRLESVESEVVAEPDSNVRRNQSFKEGDEH